MNHYLYHLIPKPLTACSTRNSKDLLSIKAKHSFFKSTFFPSCITEWNKLDSNTALLLLRNFSKNES